MSSGHEEVITLATPKPTPKRGGPRKKGQFTVKMAPDEIDADLDELVERARDYYPAHRAGPQTRERGKLVNYLRTADPRIPKGLFHMERDTLFSTAEEFEELSRIESRGQDAGMGLVDGCLICLSKILSGASWPQMQAHLRFWSRSALQRAMNRFIRPLADYARSQLNVDFGASGHYDIYQTASHLLTTMELPLRQEDVEGGGEFVQFFYQSAEYGRAAVRVIAAVSPRGEFYPLCTAGGRNNPAFVINTSPELLRMLTYTTLEIVESMPMVIQHRRDVLIDPNAGIGDISETFPGAKVLRHVPGTRSKDKRFNDEVDRLLKELHLRKERVKLISQVFTVARASPYSLSHTDDVVAIAFWAANMVRIKEGEIPPVPDGYQRKVPASLPEVSKDTRVMPAPLKIYQPNVFTGITPATLHLYAGRPVPRLHRTESEVQPSIEEAYPDGVC